MSYIALRSLKVQKADGTMDLRQPGEPVPEAAKWRNLELWVRRGWVAPADAEATNQILHKAKPKPMIPVDPGGKPIEDLEAYKAKRDSVVAAPSEPAGAVALTHESLSKLTKVQLIQLGEKYGLTLNDTGLKEELIGAVLTASKG